MEELLKLIIDNPDFEIDLDDKWSVLRDDETNEITHIYFKTDLLTMCIVCPHEGNQNRYILRSHAIINFDRWSVAASEYFFEKPDHLAIMLLNGMTRLYRDALEDLAYDYERVIVVKEFYEDKYYDLKWKYEPDKDFEEADE